jgi:acyl-CoA synthetase (AMP-forming)/AMP-acid ligase II
MPVLLTELGADRAADRATAPAIVADDSTLSWVALADRVNRWIEVLRGLGVRDGDRIACVLGNGTAAFEVLLAGLHTGATVVPVNWHLTDVEIAHILADSGSRALIVEPAYAPAATRAMARAGAAVVARLVVGEVDTDGFTAAEPLLRAANGVEPAGQRLGTVMLYTSGTTGVPKGVSNGLFVAGSPFDRVQRLLRYAHAVLDVPAGGRVLLVGPWYHSAQLFFALLALLQGSRLVVHRRFDPTATLATIDAHRITAVHLVPTQFVRLLRLDPAVRAAFSGSSLRRVWHGGGRCAADVKRRMIEWWGPVFWEYYAATEGGVVTLIDSADWLRRPGSVGRAVPPNEVLVVDDAGTPLPPGHPGRVFVRRAKGGTFTYHNAPDKTRAAHLEPGVFTYGELGYLDADGYLFLTGRAQDMVVSGGVNVYPAEVEVVLLTHPAVRDAAVVGIPDDEYGERVVAVIELDPDRPPSQVDGLAELLDRHCRRTLAGFKVPRGYRVVAELPRDATGKLRKDAVRDAYTDRPMVNHP